MSIKLSNIMNARTYTLLIYNTKDTKIHIGRLGILDFTRGFYVYFGSAKKNIIPRIKRHLLNNKKKFWHIDYFLSSKGVQIREIWTSPKEQECQMAQRFLERGYPYIEKFGSSDCRCWSHLFFADKKLTIIKNLLKKNGFRNVYILPN